MTSLVAYAPASGKRGTPLSSASPSPDLFILGQARADVRQKVRRTFAATCFRNLSITWLVVKPQTIFKLASNTAKIFSFTRR